MTAVARVFWPSVAASVENRTPAPLASEPAGMSSCLAALAIVPAFRAGPLAAAGSTSRKRTQAAENPERPSSVGPAPASIGPWMPYSGP